jgi:hypothetical protein
MRGSRTNDLSRTLVLTLCMTALALSASVGMAQTTTPGSAIDVEVYFADTGDNYKCVAPGETFWANIWVSPGTGAETCALSCAPPAAAGGSANLATGIVDVSHDTSVIEYLAAENNETTAAVDGLIQNNSANGRVGWALAGDWTVDADPTSSLVSPCAMGKLTSPSWVYRVQYRAALDTTGSTLLHLRRETDPSPFGLSFADICGSPAFKASNGGIDQIRDAIVMFSDQCDSLIFADNLELGETARWSAIIG